eukprot:scaffold3958_cov103-Isochrysis_galbana.AAC.2
MSISVFSWLALLALCHAPGSYKSRHSRVSAQVPMTFPIASAARRSAVPIPAPGDRPARHVLDIRDPGPLPDPDESRLAPGMPS